MDDVWTYDGTTGVGDTWTAEVPAVNWRFFGTAEPSFTADFGPFTGTGSAGFTLSGAQTAGDFFNVQRFQTFGPMWGYGLFLQGTSGPQTVSHGAMSYDGTGTVTCTVHSSNALYEYELTDTSVTAWTAGNGGDLPLTLDVSAYAAGAEIDVYLQVRVAAAAASGGFADLKVFTAGTAGAGDDPWAYVSPATTEVLHLAGTF